MTKPNEQRITEIKDKSEFGRVVRVQANTVHDLMADIRFLLEQLQQTKEELERVTNIKTQGVPLIKELHGDNAALRRELEQVKAEGDYWQRNSTEVEGELVRNVVELSAKDKVLDFAKEVLRVAFAGGSLDGGDIQGMGVKYGLLREEGYDPEKHEENWDFEPGDPYFVFTPILSQYKGEHS